MNNIIISAKERKRLIRERRRSLQNQSAPESSAADDAVDSNDIAIDVTSVHTNQDSTEQASKARKLDLRKDDFLDQTNGSYSSRASTAYLSSEGTRDATIQPASSMNEEFADVTSSTAPRSLFSAVMSRSSGTPDEKQNEDNTTSLLGKVMQSANTTERHINGVTFSTSTPIKSPSKRLFDKVNSPGRSPGGYGIMKALDGVSNFTQSFYNMDNEDEAEQEDDGRQSQEEYHIAKIITRCVPLHLTIEREVQHDNTNSFDTIIEETKMADSTSTDTSFYQEPIGIQLMDWSLKKRVRILCSSGSLPGIVLSSFSRDRKKWPPPDDGLVQQLAIHTILHPNKSSVLFEECHGRQPSLEESAMAKWLSAIMYYQHPAIHPLPASVLLDSNTNSKTKNSNEHHLSSFNHRRTYQRVRLPGIGSMGGLGTSEKLQKSILEANATKSAPSGLTSSFPSMVDKRICEWQQAFTSMYNCWISKITKLERHISKSLERPSSDEVSRCCFYSISPKQMILFRAIVSKDGKVFPTIAFSSTTAELRAKVKSMGAMLKVQRLSKTSNGNTEQEMKFTEDMLEIAQPKLQPESQGEAADLRALREANNSSTDNRPTEVEVTQKKKSQSDNKASSISPLYVSGIDDCAVVHDLLLNTCGLSVTGSIGNWQFEHDVPLLLCRSIGPSLNTILKTLSVSARRDNVYWMQLNGEQGRSEHNSESVLELYGPILPCSLRDIMCASINWMALNDKLDQFSAFDAPTQPMNGKDTNSEKKKESRQLSMFLQAHEGEFPITLPTSTGVASSYCFNGSGVNFLNESKHTWYECGKGEGLGSLVWNSSRSNELSYSTYYTT